MAKCLLITRILWCDVEIFTCQTCWNGLTVVLAAHVVILGVQVLVNLGEECADFVSILACSTSCLVGIVEVLVG